MKNRSQAIMMNFQLRQLVNLIRPLFVVMVVAFAFVAAQPAMAQSEAGETVLVHFAPETTQEMRDAAIAQMGGELVTWMYQINVAEVRLQAGVAVASVSSVANGAVTYAESDLVVEATTIVANDPDLSDTTMSYGLDQVGALEAWDVITGSQDIIIAVVDSGVKLDHPEFAGRLVPGYDFVNDDDQADDDMGHGTHVAGIIAAALGNGQGSAGVCPNCRIMPVKVLNENNLGSWSQLAKGVLFAADHGARVINLSLGANISSETLADAIKYAIGKGVVVVAAAGNNGTNAPFYPAALDGVIAVGATSSDGSRWTRSNYGSYIDVVAPGSLIYSTYFDLNNMYHGYTYMSGTSMATPFVSGVVGLLLSVKPELNVQQVTEALTVGAEDLGASGWDDEFGYGRVNAIGALSSPVVGMVMDLGDVTPVEEVPVKEAPLEEAPVAVQGVTMFLPVLSNQ